MKKENIFRYSLCLLLCLVLLTSVMPLPSRAIDDTWIHNAAQDLRETMVNREGEIEFTYKSDSWIFSPEALGEGPEAEAALGKEIYPIMERIYQLAIAHTGVGNEGDYLRWHLKSCEEGFNYRYTQEGGQTRVEYTFKFFLTYYTTKAQEDAVTDKVQQVLSQLQLAGKSDYEKVKAIYDYLCNNVVYDNANLNNQSYDLKFTAYAALINGTSVCQGYSNLLYRLALEAGVDCRFIFGQSQGGNHSWNIVKLDGVYYNLDATWDAVTKDYSFFLKTDGNMTDHTKDPEYIEPAFLAAYPLANSDYAIPGNTPPVTPPPVTPPPVTPPPQEDPQPTTTPTIPATQPETEPATQPETQPATQPETQPMTQPSQPTTEPTTVPAATDPATIPTEITTPGTSQSAMDTQQNTTEKLNSSGKTGEEKSNKTLFLAVGGAVLLCAAAGVAILTGKKRKKE